MKRLAVRYAMVALLLTGSASLLSCAESETEDTAASDETLMTEFSENLSIVMSRNGQRSYYFISPLVEGYSLAREPYREFRKGIKITTYQDDSLSTVDAVLTANYAIYYEQRELWEAKGNVVAEKSDGKTLYTQQLFWNQRTKKIYSNVDSKIVQSGGRDVFIGEGFESDEEFKDWRFRRMKGRMEVDVAPTQGADSTAARPAGEVSAPSARGSAAATPVTVPKAPTTKDAPAVSPRPAAPTSRAATPESRPAVSTSRAAQPAAMTESAVEAVSAKASVEVAPEKNNTQK